MEFNTEIFAQFDKKWALLTAGNMDSFNTMTISWGGMGTLWGKPVVTTYVRQSRYTHEFMDENDYYTISFYPEQYKSVLGVLGSKSGRDIDKMHDSGLNAKAVDNGITFAEAEKTLICRKLFKQELSVDNIISEEDKAFYNGDAVHDMYIGEVVAII